MWRVKWRASPPPSRPIAAAGTAAGTRSGRATHGEITTTAWVIDRVTGNERRRRLKATADHKADSKRTAVEFWTAEAYVRSDQGRTRFQSRGKTKDEAIERLSQRMSPSAGDPLAEALAIESGRVTAFTNDSTLGEVLNAWITDPVTTDVRAVGTVLRYRHAIDKTIKKRNVGTASLGSVSLDRVTPRVVTLFLASLTPAVAKTCRGILRQALTYAVANGASAPTTNGTFAVLSRRVERGTSSPTTPTLPFYQGPGGADYRRPQGRWWVPVNPPGESGDCLKR